MKTLNESMKSFGVLMMSLTTIALPQQPLPQPDQSPKDMMILNYDWRIERRELLTGGREPDRPPTNTNGNLSIPTPLTRKSITVYIYSLKLKNAGERTITAVGWDYVFTDPATQNEVDRLHFRSATQIRGGKTDTILETTLSPPSRLVTVSSVGQNHRDPKDERIVITCLKYKNGAIWSLNSTVQNCEPRPKSKP